MPGVNSAVKQYWSKPTKVLLDAGPARKALRNLYFSSMRRRVDLWAESQKFDELIDGRRITWRILQSGFRDYRAAVQGGRCCYCRGELIGSKGGRPVEHVLPRSHYPQFSFCFWNLAISCPRCNGIKTNHDWMMALNKRSRRYPRPVDSAHFFHPVYDAYGDHVWMRRVSDGHSSVAVFVGLTDKGRHLCSSVLNKVSKVETRVAGSPGLAKSLDLIDGLVSGIAVPANGDYVRFREQLKVVLGGL